MSNTYLTRVMYPVFRVRFRWRDKNAKTVKLVHSYDNWKIQINLTKISQTIFETIINLPLGEYEYKFIVDGQWKHSDNCSTKKNVFGTLNNIVFISGNHIIKNYIKEHKHVSIKNGVIIYNTFYPEIIDNEKNIFNNKYNSIHI